jgi:hypothetical protein
MGYFKQLEIEMQEQGLDMADTFDMHDQTWWHEQDDALAPKRDRIGVTDDLPSMSEYRAFEAQAEADAMNFRGEIERNRLGG